MAQEIRRFAKNEGMRFDRVSCRCAPPAAHHVEALVELGHEARDVGGVVLQVAVRGHDDLAPRVVEAGRERRGLAEVAAQAHARARGGRAPRARAMRLGGAVARAVVDEEDLVGPAQGLEARRELRWRSATFSASLKRGTTTETKTGRLAMWRSISDGLERPSARGDDQERPVDEHEGHGEDAHRGVPRGSEMEAQGPPRGQQRQVGDAPHEQGQCPRVTRGFISERSGEVAGERGGRRRGSRRRSGRAGR